MAVLVDTPIWSLAFRRPPARLDVEQSLTVSALWKLIEQENARMIGPVRQELLTGLKGLDAYNRVKELLRAMEDEPLETGDFEVAAWSANQCRAAGVATTPVDMVLCAVAARRNWEIYTLDQDFVRYAQHLGLSLFQPRHPTT